VRTFVRSVLVSLVTLTAEFTLLPILHDVVGLADAVCYGAVQVAGTTITFTLSRHWAFEAAYAGTLRAQGARYLAVFLGSFALNTALPSVGSYALGMPLVPSFAASQALVYLGWNYPMNRWWVFRAAARRRMKAVVVRQSSCS
jgi:hypothetical protein